MLVVIIIVIFILLIWLLYNNGILVRDPGSLCKEDKDALEWAKQALQAADKASNPLGLYSSNAIIAYGNELVVYIQDWYDNMIPNCGHEYSLEKWFKFTPSEEHSDIYEGIFRLKIRSNGKAFLKILKKELEESCGDFEYDSSIPSLSKKYRNE